MRQRWRFGKERQFRAERISSPVSKLLSLHSQASLSRHRRRAARAHGAGVKELRIREVAGAFRVIYLATRPEGMYVLHCFQRTSLHDLRLGKQQSGAATRVSHA